MNDADKKAFETWCIKEYGYTMGELEDAAKFGWKAACEWRDSQMGKPFTQPNDIQGLIKAAFDWIESVPHGDNCFVSNNYDGDPGNRCNCGKDSILSAYNEINLEDISFSLQCLFGNEPVAKVTHKNTNCIGWNPRFSPLSMEDNSPLYLANPDMQINQQLVEALERIADIDADTHVFHDIANNAIQAAKQYKEQQC